jgi:regulation of enolase protein 1 (concanavalin A-like superfamily)
MRPLRCVLVAALLLAAAPLSAEPLITMASNGPSANRMDMVFLGDGYTSAQQGKFASDVAVFVDKFFGESPFQQYRPYFNIHRVEVASAQSGADHPSSNSFRNTALGAAFDCAGITRLICVDWSAVNDVLARSASFEQRDIIIVVVNDPQYGGSGGSIAVSSTHPDGYDVVLHEVGHSFGLLADEYSYGPPSCFTDSEFVEPNVTLQTSRASIKWRHWIAPGTAVPTTTVNPGEPGLYEGAKYCSDGAYRATFNSKMRSLFQPFEQVNAEQLTKRMYNFVSPIDDYSPGVSLVTNRGVVAFSVLPMRPASHTLGVRWELDGALVSTATGTSVDTRTLSPGDHRLVATVRDGTALVRNDPEQLLSESRTWVIRVPATATLPAGWSNADIGAVGRAGSASANAGTFTVQGGGADVWGTADAFHFVYTPLAGNGTIVARVASINGSQAWTKMGVMIRASTSPGAQHAFMLVSSGKGLAFQRRVTAGGASTHTAGPGGSAPRWVRLQRAGNVITASASPDGTTWTVVGSETIVMPADVLIGLVSHGHTTSGLATATFDGVALTRPATATALPSGWSNGDIGAVGRTGSASASGGTFTLKGAGADIWGTADAFHFAYRARTGDGTIVARVASINGSQAWTKMGVMIRASTSPGAQHALMLVSTGKGTAFQRRVTAGGMSTSTAGPSGTAPRWVKLTRAGNLFTASTSTNGTTWTVVGSQTIAMPTTALWGLTGHGHTTTSLATATFESVSIGS